MAYDVLVVGGGVMGSSTAYHLVRSEPALSIAVIERDNSYEHASTVRSDGNVRIQFNLEENIRISQHTMKVLETFADDMSTESFRPEVTSRRQGNLFMVDEHDKADALAGLRTQQNLGCAVEWLEIPEVEKRFASYKSTGQLVGATFGPQDGSVDPTAVLRGYRAKATEMGVEFVEASVDRLLVSDNQVRGVVLSDGVEVRGSTLVVTAGAWSVALLKGVGVDVPVTPLMRTVYLVSTPFSSDGLPSVFLPGGIYANTEGENLWLMGMSQPDDPIGFEFVPASRQRFENLIWPGLVDHFPAFEELRVENSWAGVYAVNNLDGNAILGEWPDLRGLFMATGFSGHGFQQAPAVGRYLAESILDQPHQIDLGRLGGQRIIDRQPLYEHPRRLI